nr:hypothetical protein [Tanacetum cinerariifolium]
TKKKGLVKESKPLKKQAQIEQDEAYARELEAELKKNINWDDVIEQVQRKEKEDNVVMRNMTGFKMDYFKGMSYDNICPIFEKYFNSNVAFIEKAKEKMEEEDSRVLQRKTKSSEEKAVKKQKLDEEVTVVDYEIYSKNNNPYFKIIRADGSHQLFLSFLSLLRNFDREDLETKKKGLVKESKPLKKQAQIEQDEAYARELEAELKKNINWDDVIEQVQRKEKEDNVVMRNMTGFKMDYFKGMSYDNICPIFEKYFNSNVAFIEKAKEKMEEEDSRVLQRKTKSSEEKAVKKQKLDEEVEELKKHL